jgi:hypothetical protein
LACQGPHIVAGLQGAAHAVRRDIAARVMGECELVGREILVQPVHREVHVDIGVAGEGVDIVGHGAPATAEPCRARTRMG